ncbi:MAG: carbohydrate kinase [Gammaproteobacteria bacterium]
MTRQPGRPIIFGEVLFDRFEDGSAVLGGAPFNVAWHLQGLGLRPLFVSRVGDDAAGRRVLDTMAAWGMDTSGVQRDARHPTGAVQVTLDAGQPSYEILPDQAYDFVDLAPLLESAADASLSLLYHGTLAARSPASRETLFALHERLGLPAFVDINLRAPWWRHDLVERAIAAARWVKLNDDEMAEVLERDAVAGDSIDGEAQAMCQRLGLDLVIVTRGGAGACFARKGEVWCDEPAAVEKVVDTVGAGDAFAAVAILGLTKGWSPPRILRRALGFAAEICQVRGATVDDPTLYRKQWNQWIDEPEG